MDRTGTKEKESWKRTMQKKRKALKMESSLRDNLSLLLAIAEVLIMAFTLFYTLQKDKKEEEIDKLASQPRFEAVWGSIVPIGMEDYWRIDLTNKNENNITSGIFTIQYMVVFRTEAGVDEAIRWDNVFMESEIAYDDDLQGCFLLIKDDFLKYEDFVMDKCVNHGIEVAECGSYAFCGFQYVEEGQEKTVYYLICLKPYEKCKVTEVRDPDKYVESRVGIRKVF